MMHPVLEHLPDFRSFFTKGSMHDASAQPTLGGSSTRILAGFPLRRYVLNRWYPGSCSRANASSAFTEIATYSPVLVGKRMMVGKSRCISTNTFCALCVICVPSNQPP